MEEEEEGGRGRNRMRRECWDVQTQICSFIATI